MINEICLWNQLLDERLYGDTKNKQDEIDLMPVKTSCRKYYAWVANAEVDGVRSTDITEYKYCPFCGRGLQSALVIDL